MEVEMKRILILPLLTLSMGGCAVLSSSPAPSGASQTASASPYETMESLPPEAQREDVPKLEEKQVWVPGYYQPVAGTWVWHQGEVRESKDGYNLIPAQTREENGKFVFSPPRWRRSDLASQAKQ